MLASPFVILGMLGLFCPFNSSLDRKSYQQTNLDPDQTPHNVAALWPFYEFSGKDGLKDSVFQSHSYKVQSNLY